MTRYLISFGVHAMDHIPEGDIHQVAQAARSVVQDAVNAGAYVVAGGLEDRRAIVVGADGTVTDGPYLEAIGGLTVVDVTSREEAVAWAEKMAVACRCAQEVRTLGADPELDEMIRQARGGKSPG
ncbi:MAG: YciI family protein [Mycobacteriales bacterium]